MADRPPQRRDEAAPPAPLVRDRETAVRRLAAHFARDDLTIDEYEERLDAAWDATTPQELALVLRGLPELQEQAAEGEVTAVADPETVRDRGFQVAVFGGSERKGEWTPPRHLYTVAVMGGASLDFREARMPPGLTEVFIIAVMGGAEVIVPPGLAVETDAFALMGGIDGRDQAPSGADPYAPRLKIRGVAVMGGIEVNVRLPGETPGDARKRLKRERRERRHRRLKRGPDES